MTSPLDKAKWEKKFVTQCGEGEHNNLGNENESKATDFNALEKNERKTIGKKKRFGSEKEVKQRNCAELVNWRDKRGRQT